MSKYGNSQLLKSLNNPTTHKYEVIISCPELTFLGSKEQPDFGCVNVTMVPSDAVVELKSFKHYIYSFRNSLMSYERFINTLYDDIVNVYQPVYLKIEVEFKPRGGISSKLIIDSDWR